MNTKTEYNPSWISPPGDSIGQALSLLKIDIEKFSEAIELSISECNALISGDRRIDAETADNLEKSIGGSASFWIKRDRNYTENLAKLELAENKLEWIKQFPLKEMTNFGWISPSESEDDKFESLLDFFGVSSITSWRKYFANSIQSAAFRISPAFSSRDGSVSAWLRQGEKEAKKKLNELSLWNKQKCISNIPKLRELTTIEKPAVFLPRLERICSSFGVSVNLISSLPGCPASGACWRLNETKRVILLSCRHLTDDHFWFTFFHELGHLVLHDTDNLYLDTEKPADSKYEKEASKFAEDVLIPKEFRHEYETMHESLFSIVKLSKKIGVSPGIIVGQLQFHKRIRFNHFNGLKKKFFKI